MDLDELRNNYKRKLGEYVENIDKVYSHHSSSAYNNITDMSESSDISVAFVANDNFYFCFGETGQKLKIPMSSFTDKDGKLLTAEGILEKIDSFLISLSIKSSEGLSVYEYCRSTTSLLKSSDIIFIFYNPVVKSYLNALDVLNEYGGSIYMRLMSEIQIAGFGAVVGYANNEGDHSYRYRNRVMDLETGYGIIEIKECRKSSSYITPSIKDIIKGTIVLIGVLEGSIKDMILLSMTSFNLKFVIYENERVRDVKLVIDKDTTLPIRKSIDLYLESNQRVEIEMDDMAVTSDISQYFDQISCVEVYATEDIIISGKKENKDVSISLSTLIRSRPR